MKLMTKTLIYFLGISIIVFGIGGVVTYNLIKNEIAKETEYHMRRSVERVERSLKRGRMTNYKSNTLQIEEVEGPETEIVFTDTLGMHPQMNQLEIMRNLHVVRKINDKFYEINYMDVIIEQSDIYDSTVQIIIRLFALLALALIFSSFFISRHLLRPFQKTLDKIQNFRIQEPVSLELPKTKTKEFTRLNRFINAMTESAQKEYQSLKNFSENASHEIQTPLAIAQGKLDNLADTDGITSEQFALITSAQNALHKLSRVGKSLSLLTKIENKEFDSTEKTNISDLTQEALDNFKELFAMKNLKVKSTIAPGVVIRMDSHLGTILVNNLIHNAIKHNLEGGYVNIEMDGKRLRINNSGHPPESSPEKMFNRFEKNGMNVDSSGLGLSIVKEICDFHSMNVHYTYNTDHQLEVEF